MRTPAQALAWAEAQTTWTPKSCLNFVKTAYFGAETSPLGLSGIIAGTALEAWAHVDGKVTDGSLPPNGFPMYFDGIAGDPDGDVQLYMAANMSRRTDVGAWGKVGTTSALWMETVNHHRYLGWGTSFLGAPLTAPTPPKETPVADATETDIHDTVHQTLAILRGSDAYTQAKKYYSSQINDACKANLGRSASQDIIDLYLPYLLDGHSITGVVVAIRKSPESVKYLQKKAK